MIKTIHIKIKEHGLYLSAKTASNNYGQFYNTVDPTAVNFVNSAKEAEARFLNFYNQFE